MRDRNVSVPAEMSVIGFDDLIFTQLLHPPVTTVRQPIADLAQVGVSILLDCIKGISHRGEVVRLPVQLIKRTLVARPTSRSSHRESPVRSLHASQASHIGRELSELRDEIQT